MYIKRVTLSEFGRLTGTIEFERDRCNVICQDNEYGKTTIMDAVLYALYNFPTTGFTRDTIKPKDKYRPWNAAQRTPNVFMVELDIYDVAGRNYTLRADFARNQPFSLYDADTKQPIPLDGMSFGQRYLRMPLSSFTQAFFLRQDEKEGTQKSQLVSVIEEAASSNRRDTPGNVRQALENLGAPRMAMPPLVEEPVLTKTLLRRLDERRAEAVNMHRALKDRMDQFAREIEAQDSLDGQLGELSDKLSLTEYALLVARTKEKQLLLSRYNEGRDAQAGREKLLRELEPYAGYDPSRRTEIVSLLGEWKLARQRHGEAASNLEGELGSQIKALQAQLAELPAEATGLGPADLDTLREARTVIADRESQLEREWEKLQQMETDMAARGVPLDRLTELHDKELTLAPADREILFEHSAARMEAQSALVELETSANAFREQVRHAKERRSRFGNIGMGVLVAGIALMAVGIVFLLTDNYFFGWAFILIALAVGGLSSLYVGGMRSKITAQELDPALQAEMQLAGQVHQIREQLEAIEAEYTDTLQRLSLSPEHVAELKEVEHWKQASASWVASKESIARLSEDLDEARRESLQVARTVDPATDAELLSGEFLLELVGRLQQHMDSKTRLGELQEQANRNTDLLKNLADDLAVKAEALGTLVKAGGQHDGEEQADLDALAQTYLAGCEKALKLQTLKEEYGTVSSMTEQEAAQLQTDVDALLKQQEAQLGFDAQHPGLSALPPRPEELERQIATLRGELEELKERRNRGFRDAEQAVSDWREKGPELEGLISDLDDRLARVRDFEEACLLAHTELSAISEQVYTQWATALNERVNRIVPLINDRYVDVALSPQLDISVYSREAGRRLDTRAIQHLSKGARDQLMLAMRVAIAEYLSSHVGNLPLALDEPFAHWDDQRFTEGMRFVSKLAEKHQVIMLTCHSWRYDQLRQTAPEIMDNLNFAKLTPA